METAKMWNFVFLFLMTYLRMPEQKIIKFLYSIGINYAQVLDDFENDRNYCIAMETGKSFPILTLWEKP